MLRLRREDFDNAGQLGRLATTVGLTPEEFRREFGYLTQHEPVAAALSRTGRRGRSRSRLTAPAAVGPLGSRRMRDLRKRAETLRRAAAPLEPGPDERRRLAATVVGHAEEFLEALAAGPAYWTPGDGAAMRNLELGAEARPIDELLALISAEVERQGVNPAHPRDFGWVPGGGLYASALGDYLAAVSNTYAGYSPACPGAVRVEHRMVRWIADLVGYPESAGGVLTSGGSVAILTAILAASRRSGPRAGGDPGPRGVCHRGTALRSGEGASHSRSA